MNSVQTRNFVMLHFMKNYRGITVASIILKVLETICLKEEVEEATDGICNMMQFGFTKERSPSMASLIITESIAEARSKKQELNVASLDARKAFDVVSHPILMKKLYDMGISSPIWGTINSIYNDSVEVIRWAGRNSRQ